MAKLTEKMILALERIAAAVEKMNAEAERQKRPLTDAQLAQRRAACAKRLQKPIPASPPTPTKQRKMTEAVTAPSTAVAPKGGGNTGMLIKTYCDAYKLRYGCSPVIQGKDAGQLGTLLKSLSLERAGELVQAYLQMEDRWFLTKCHDVPTFIQSVSKVAVALANGTADPHEKGFWNKVFGGGDERGTVQNSNETSGGYLGGAKLPGGEAQALLADVSDDD